MKIHHAGDDKKALYHLCALMPSGIHATMAGQIHDEIFC